jgi:hypothetical protein
MNLKSLPLIAKHQPRSSWFLPLLFVIYPLLYMGRTLSLNTSLRLGHQPSDYNLVIGQVQLWKTLKWPWSESSFHSFPELRSTWRVEDLVGLQFRTYAWISSKFFEAGFIVNFYTFAGIIATGLCIYFLIREFSTNKQVAVLGGLLGQMLPWLRQNILFNHAGSWYTVGPLLVVLLIVRFRKNPTLRGATKIFGSLIFCLTLSVYAFFFSIFILLFVIFSDLPRIYIWSRRFHRRIKIIVVLSGTLFIFVAVISIKYLLRYTRNEIGSPLGVYNTQVILQNRNTLRGFVSPDHFHLLFPRRDTYRIDGDDQNYAGMLIVLAAIFSWIQIWRYKSFGYYKVLVVSTIGFLLLSLGRYHVGPLTIPSLREYTRFFMPGIRQFVRTGLIVEHLLIVFAMIFLSRVLIRFNRKYLQALVFCTAGLLLIADLNPNSRRVFWDYSDRFEEVRKVLKENPKQGLFVPNGVATFPTVGLQGLGDLFNAPLTTDFLGIYPYAAEGSEALAQFLAKRDVGYVFARLERNTGRPYMTGFIQDAARFTTYFDESYFSPISQVVLMENRDDTGKVLERWAGRLLRVNAIPDELLQANKRLLAQFVSSPSLEVREPNQSRFLNEVDWSVAKKIDLSPETLQEPTTSDAEKVFFRFHLQLVSPSESSTAGALSILVNVGSDVNRYDVFDNSEMIQIDVPKGQTASIESLTNCVFTSSEKDYWGLLASREVCFGIAEYWVEVMIGSEP